MRFNVLRAMALSFLLLLPSAALLAQPLAAGTPLAEYRVGAGDVLRISVYQNPDLMLETRVTEAGMISYPLIGSARVGGLSVSAVEQLIGDALRNGNFVKSPQVTVVVVQVRGHQANVLGQVNRPGRFPLETASMRLSDLLALAGGATQTASETVVVIGQREGKPVRIEVDLPSLFATAQRATDVEIVNGDVIWVDRVQQVYIYGEVQRPGAMRLERGMSLMQALAVGGGLTPRGTERGIRVHRKDASGQVQALQLAPQDALKDGDVVYVRESIF